MTLRVPPAGGGASPIAVNPDDLGYDLIILAGQSNMIGADDEFAVTTDPPDGRVFQFPSSGASANTVIGATEPLQHWGPIGVGPGLPFGRWYAGIVPTNRKVLLVPVASNATGFEEGSVRWKVSHTPIEDNLYESMISQTEAALEAAGENARVAAVLWVQGESDAILTATANVYEANLDDLIDGLRDRLDVPDLPFVVGQMNVPAFGTSAPINTVNAVHVGTPARKPYTAYVPHPGGEDLDNTHFSAAQQRTIGKNMVGGYLDAIANVP